ncbi:axial budding pattern protein 2 [Trichoderma asperellum]|uniref:Axial budding pattern protein 2 n=1 Tax=Trichoderma asperellum TaxID=101201 RepID=A0A6V8QWA4_TRIAP|nr:axial budding pattern protein 2 [Trichoderma asperellum]
MASLFAVLYAFRLLETAWAEPAPSYPFNAQLPPAARIDRLFSYSFSPNTFTSNSNITYSLGHHPSWLSLEKGGRRLYGTPKDDDIPAGEVVGQQFDLIATDSIGSASMNATIVISRNPPPSVKIPISQQMDSLGQFSAPSSLLSYPSTDFRYTFDPDTFGAGNNFSYYASTNDSTPLPAWITFDKQTLTFSGRTPAFESLVQPPQKFDFNLVASDIVGFSGTTLSFAIVVGSHKLTTDHPVIQLNATRGSKISYDGLANGIQLDNKAIKPSSLNVSTENMPSWLSLDPETLLLEGTPTSNDESASFTIIIHDSFADVLNIHVRTDVGTGLFQSNLQKDIEIQPGDEFNLDLSSYFRDPKDIDLKVDLDPEPGWLHVDGLKISGNAPKTAKGKFKLSLKATSKSTGLSESEVLQAAFLSPDRATSSSGSHTSNSTMPAGMSSEDAPPHRLNTTDILLATLLPILFLTFAIMLIVKKIGYFARCFHTQAYSYSANGIGSSACHGQEHTTLPEAAQLYLPTSSFLTEAGGSAFRSGLDLTLPSFDDLANIQPMSVAPHNVSSERTLSGAFSATTSSSAALPSVLSTVQDIQEPFDPSLVSRAKEPTNKPVTKEKEPATETRADGEAAESISELKQPSQARLSSHKWLSRRGSSWMNTASISNRAKSFQTEPSFGSNENWRALAQRDPSIAYLELVDETPFLPSRSASRTNVSQLEERRSLELMSPSKWGEDERKSTIRPMRSTAAISAVSEGGTSSVFGEREAATWRREASAAKVSERSFKMFI